MKNKTLLQDLKALTAALEESGTTVNHQSDGVMVVGIPDADVGGIPIAFGCSGNPPMLLAAAATAVGHHLGDEALDNPRVVEEGLPSFVTSVLAAIRAGLCHAGNAGRMNRLFDEAVAEAVETLKNSEGLEGSVETLGSGDAMAARLAKKDESVEELEALFDDIEDQLDKPKAKKVASEFYDSLGLVVKPQGGKN